jgi:hypothetical protein
MPGKFINGYRKQAAGTQLFIVFAFNFVLWLSGEIVSNALFEEKPKSTGRLLVSVMVMAIS